MVRSLMFRHTKAQIDAETSLPPISSQTVAVELSQAEKQFYGTALQANRRRRRHATDRHYRCCALICAPNSHRTRYRPLQTCVDSLRGAMRQYSLNLDDMEKWGVQMQLPRGFAKKMEKAQAACCFPESLAFEEREGDAVAMPPPTFAGGEVLRRSAKLRALVQIIRDVDASGSGGGGGSVGGGGVEESKIAEAQRAEDKGPAAKKKFVAWSPGIVGVTKGLYPA